MTKVAPAFQKSKIDEYLQKLKLHSQLTENNIIEILKVHSYLIKIIRDLTDDNKRSFSSKYLHFHLPNLFFIYDERAIQAISKLKIKFQYKYKTIINSENVDKEYASFFYKCWYLMKYVKEKYNKELTPRHLDNILMKIVEKN